MRTVGGNGIVPGAALLWAALSAGCVDYTVCGATTSAGACVNVVHLLPVDGTGAPDGTSNVDVVQSTCRAGNPPVDTAEPFTDHSLRVMISNRPQPQMEDNRKPAVVLQSYRVDFTVNDCPRGANCPVIAPVITTSGETVTIEADAQAEFSIPFVPLRRKVEWVAAGGTATAYPSYAARVTMEGADLPGNHFTLVGYTEATLGAFDNCAALAASGQSGSDLGAADDAAQP